MPKPLGAGRRVFAVILCGILLTFAAPVAAHAQGELELSSDGVHWGTSLSKPLFTAEMGALAPGNSLSANLWVCNQSQDRAELTAAVNDGVAQDLVTQGFLNVVAQAQGQSIPLLPHPEKSIVISAGTQEKLSLTVTLDLAAPNQTELLNFPLSLRLTLAQSLPFPTTPPSTPIATPSPSFPVTGEPTVVSGKLPPEGQKPLPGETAETGANVVWAVGAAAVALLFGMALLLFMRRRARAEMIPSAMPIGAQRMDTQLVNTGRRETGQIETELGSADQESIRRMSAEEES